MRRRLSNSKRPRKDERAAAAVKALLELAPARSLSRSVYDALGALMLSACAYEKAGEYGDGERLTDLAARAVEFSRALERDTRTSSREAGSA